MFRGNSLGLYLNKTPNKHNRRPSSSIKQQPSTNPQLSSLKQSQGLHKSGHWRVRLDRYSRKQPETTSHRLNMTSKNSPLVQNSVNDQRIHKQRDNIRISPRMKRINNSKPIRFVDGTVGADRKGQGWEDLVEPSVAYFKGSQGEGDISDACDGVLDLYRDYHNDMRQACFMAKHIKVEIQKPINLPKKVKHPKTVILDLDQTLVHCVFSSPQAQVKVLVNVHGQSVQTGINIRPQCNHFLHQLSKIAEICVWTASQQNYADAVLNHLDPNKQLISHRMYRDHCTFAYGVHLKDLRRINRSLENMVLVDNSVFCFLLEMDNGVPVHPYFEGAEDRELGKLLEYLRVLMRQPDVRVMNREHLALERFRKGSGGGAGLERSKQLR